MSFENSSQPSETGLESAAGWSPRSAGERILMQLKMHGALTAVALGDLVGTTGEAARQQLLRLAEDGLVVATDIRSGVGRPRQHWQLTAAGTARFPDTHAALTVGLLDAIRTELGEAALETVIAARERQTRETYSRALDGCETLGERVSALSALRSAEGYMSATSEQPDGSLMLIENHCPICAAAAQCQGFCRAELDIFRALLGPGVDVRREEHVIAGGRRCTYIIRANPA